ncbi:MAG: DUF177 domain-containing protein [Burkholderiales bacterium]|nr:DUF177 domain-containing protein [Burkholderiales bacterium]
MKNEFAARSLNVAAFANAGESHAGDERLARFERLLEETSGLGGETLLSYQVQGELRQDAAGQDEPWLRLRAQATLPLICQRCMGPVDVLVKFERDFRFVASEELAAIEDEESEEDVLVLTKTFNLLELVEDELLMAMPPVPKHNVCPKPVTLHAADADFSDEPAEKSNPFAVLQQIKDKGLG